MCTVTACAGAEMMTTISYTSITNHSFLCAGVRAMRTFRLYSCSNFQVYYTVLAIINSDQAVKKVSRSYFFCLSETLHLLLSLLHSSSTPTPPRQPLASAFRNLIFFRVPMWGRSCSICCSFPGLSHTSYCFPDASMLLQITLFSFIIKAK